MTVVMVMIITHFSGNLSQAFCAVILAGIFQVFLGLGRIGRFIKLVPHLVVSGFMSGIGCIIIILQIAPLLGHSAPDGSVLTIIVTLPDVVFPPNYHALGLAVITLAVMFAMPKRLASILPPALVAVLLGTVSGMLFLDKAPIIGKIPAGLPDLIMPEVSLADIPVIVRFALILAFLGAIDSLLTSLVADGVTGTYHNSNRELIGQGLGNMVAGLFGGIASAGATMRTLVNIKAGGTTRLSGAIHAAILLVLALGFSGLVSQIPLAVLAGILMKVGVDIIDWPYLKRLHRAPRPGLIIMLTTMVLTIFIDLITAVAAGIVISSLLFVSRMASTQVKTAKLIFNSDSAPELSPNEAQIIDEAKGKIVLFHMEGPLSFGSARDISKLLQSSGSREILIIDFTHVPFIDSSAALSLADTIHILHRQEDRVLLFGIQEEVLKVLKATGTLEMVSPEHVFQFRQEALFKARELLQGVL